MERKAKKRLQSHYQTSLSMGLLDRKSAYYDFVESDQFRKLFELSFQSDQSDNDGQNSQNFVVLQNHWSYSFNLITVTTIHKILQTLSVLQNRLSYRFNLIKVTTMDKILKTLSYCRTIGAIVSILSQ